MIKVHITCGTFHLICGKIRTTQFSQNYKKDQTNGYIEWRYTITMIKCWKCLKRWHCRRTFSWRTIQQLDERWTTNYTRLCSCYCEQRLDHVQLRPPTESRLSRSVTAWLFIYLFNVRNCYLLIVSSIQWCKSMILLLVTIKLLNWSPTKFVRVPTPRLR